MGEMFDANMALLAVDTRQKSAENGTPRRMTFMQYKTRERGASRKYSTAAKQLNNGDFGALTANAGDIHEIYDENTRMKRRKTLMIWLFVICCVSAYILFLLIIFWENWSVDCIRKLNVWLLVYLCL